MAETQNTIAKKGEGKSTPLKSQVMEKDEAPVRVACSDKERHESRQVDEMQLKEQELPEPIRFKDRKEIMPCLPSINLIELTTILLDPNMPSQKIMKEVADKMMLKSEESESDDGSVSSSGGGVVGMKGLLDCIFEVSYMHEDSASSDDDDYSFERFPREIPCNFCNKIFRSTMTWNTHVLVAHPQQDSSVLNIRRMSTHEADRKDRSYPPHRKHHTGSSKPDYDTKDTKVCHAKTESKRTTELPQSENMPVRKRRSSFARSQQKEVFTGKSDHKYQSTVYQEENESQLKERRIASSPPVCDVVKESEVEDKVDSQKETTESADHSVTTDQPLSETGSCESSVTEKKCVKPFSKDHYSESEEMQLTDFSDKSSVKSEEKQLGSGTAEESVDVSTNPSISEANLVHSGRKRKASHLQEPTSSLHASSSNLKRSRNIATVAACTSQDEQSDSSASDKTLKDEQPGSKGTGNSATPRTMRGL